MNRWMLVPTLAVVLTACGGGSRDGDSLNDGSVTGPDGSVIGYDGGVGQYGPFVRTENSDAWVTASFDVQSTYARVLLVGSPAAASVSVTPLDLNGTGGGAPETLSVTQTFATLQAAADAAHGGDLVVVQPGHYAGFVLGDKADAGDGHYIRFKALGDPGDVVIDSGSSEDPNWMIYLRTAHHVIVEGFNLAGTSTPGHPNGTARAGFMLDGDFGESGELTHHIAIIDNFSHNQQRWGLHSTDSHTVLLQGNLFAESGAEHGAYVSDGSDNYVIRRNVFFHNYAGGLQINLDPEAALEEAISNSRLSHHAPLEGTRAWALAVIAEGEQLFGAHEFPDGRGVSFIIEENVSNQNGEHGGGAINLASMSDSLIQNNLVYGNLAHGIAQWDNANPFDEDYVDPGPSSPSDVTGPESLPFFGCHGNVIRNNTVLMNNGGRAALQCSNGSWGCVLRNNVVINDAFSSIEITNTSIYRLDAAYSVTNRIVYENDFPDSLLSLAISLPDAHSTTGTTLAEFAAEVIDYGDEPWVVMENGWWRLNPNRPSFVPRSTSTLLVGTGDPSAMPARDLTGRSRQGTSIGAFAP